MSKLIEFIWPPTKLDPPGPVIRWMQGSTLIGVAVIGFICWAMGFGAAVGIVVAGGGFARADTVNNIALTVSCTSRANEIERKRAEIYQVRREIEMAGANARDIDKQRLDELTNRLGDEQRRYIAAGCDKLP